MTIYHEQLLTQLHELKIDLHNEPKDSPLLQLIGLVSKTYIDHDEQRIVLERTNEIATEKINLIHKKYETELNKINTVSYDGILITDVDWNVSSLNHRGEKILNAKESDFINGVITEKLMFLNSQNVHLDLTKLKHHFECGNNYICKQGVIVNLDGQGYEVFASFTIAPFYLNNCLNAYVIIFRDITQEIIKECDGILSNLKNLASIKNKEKNFLSSAQAVLANNHNGSLASELHQYVANKTNQLIKQYMITHAIRSNIQSLNQMLDNTSQLDNQQHSFLIENKLSEMNKGILKIGLSQDLTIENKVHHPIIGDDFKFEQLIYEIIAISKTTFKSTSITHLAFMPLENASSFRPWIIVQLLLQPAYSLSNDLIQSNINKLNESLSPQFFDSILVDSTNQNIKLQIILKFPMMSDGFTTSSQKTNPMRCLFYLEEYSPLMSQMKNSYLLNQLKYYVASTAEDAVQKIKEARLNKTEFNIIISDKKDFELLERSVFLEITSYINDHFFGLIYVNDEPPAHLSNLDIKAYPIPVNPLLLELRSLLYSLRALYLKNSKPIASSMEKLPFFEKRILFIDLEEYSQILYLQLFEELGLNVCLSNPHQLDPNLSNEPFDLVLINSHNDIAGLMSLLEEINALFTEVPICVFVPPLQDEDLSQILSHHIEHYLLKPFSISELLIILEHGFR